MDEEGWLTASEPTAMRKILQVGPKVSQRRCRLFACACVRRIWSLLPGAECQKALEAAELFADGKEDVQRLAVFLRRVWELVLSQQSSVAYCFTATFHAAFDQRAAAAVIPAFGSENREYDLGVACVAAEQGSYAVVWKAESDARRADQNARGAMRAAKQTEDQAQADLLRDLFANPFRSPPVLDPCWLTWNNGTIKRLAEAAYDDRLLPSGELDPARLAVLCDALLDAGCPADHEVLLHLRGPGPHVRGCAAVDLMLAKE
jgi:hypothetical protein